MKCHSLLKFALRNSLLVVLMAGACATHHASAQPEHIDEMQEFIKANATPEAIVEYERHARLFEGLLEQFLSRENNSSITTHLHHFDRALNSFKEKMVSNERYRTIHCATQRLYDRFCALVGVIRTHNGKSNAVVFLAALRPFLDCVPKKVRTKYSNPLVLINNISYRLQCS